VKKLIVVILCVFCFPLIATARRDMGPPEWTFDEIADLADWQDAHNLSIASTIAKVKSPNGVERNVLMIIATGDNPYIYPGGSVPNWEPFSGYDNKAIYLGVRVEKSDMWQVDYITGRANDYSEGLSRKFMVNATSDFADLKLDMQWEGMIRGFRLHPGTGKNKKTEIDYLSLRAPVLVTRSPRKLATTWGKIKDLF